MLGPELLVHVPAALRECRGRTRAGNPRGRPSQGTAGSIPRTGGHQPKDWQALFFNKKRLNDLTKLLEADVSEVVCGVLFWFGGLVFLRLCFMLLVFSSSPLFLPRLSIGTVQTMHWRWSTPWSWSGCLSPSVAMHPYSFTQNSGNSW